MNEAAYLGAWLPALARVPSRFAWQVAGHIGDGGKTEQQNLLHWLSERFAKMFPAARPEEHGQWAAAHVRMLRQERLDALAFQRFGRAGGPRIDIEGLAQVQQLSRERQGFILVLNHFDRLLTAPVALARYGIATDVLTMPVLDNPDLSAASRKFLLRKIATYTQVTQGTWRTTDEGMRPVLKSLKEGRAWVILADAWRPEFGRLREHAFLGGWLQLPTGIERLAESANVPLIHGVSYTQAPAHMVVRLEAMDGSPREAINTVVRQLERDVQTRPWAWWHWGLLDRMWRPRVSGPATAGANNDHK